MSVHSRLPLKFHPRYPIQGRCLPHPSAFFWNAILRWLAALRCIALVCEASFRYTSEELAHSNSSVIVWFRMHAFGICSLSKHMLGRVLIQFLKDAVNDGVPPDVCGSRQPVPPASAKLDKLNMLS